MQVPAAQLGEVSSNCTCGSSSSSVSSSTTVSAGVVVPVESTVVFPPWAELEDFLLCIILYQLPHKWMFRAGSVCRRWNSIVNKLNENDEYWRILCDARATDVKTLELPCEGVAQNKLYKYYYLTYLRGIQRGVKLLKDPYVGAPYFTHEWSCNVCNASGSHAVYHCAICGVYDMCRDCYSNGRRCRHDCVKMTSWWMTNYRFFTATRPAPVDTKKLLAIKASAAHTAAEDFPIQICMNFDEPDGPISDEDNVLRAPRPSVFFLFGGPPAHLHNAAGADGEPVEEDDEDEDEEVEGEGPQSSDEDAE